MSALLLVTLTSLIIDRPGAAVRPVVVLTPNWENILPGDTVTLTCDVGPSTSEDQTYYWYKEQEPMGIHQKNVTIRSASWMDIGDYQCHSGSSHISRPVRLHISQDTLILQRPPSIYVGGPLTLRCHIRSGYNVIQTRFYKEDEEIQSSARDSEVHIYKVDVDVAGWYRCRKVIQDEDGSLRTLSCGSYIPVTRAAVRPVVTFKPNWMNVLSGDSVTITCDGVSDDQGGHTYYWYRDDKPIDTREHSIIIQSASWRHVGGYKCYTNTTDISHPGQLNVINAILTLQRPPDIVEGDSFTLRCHSRSEYRVVGTVFYKDDIEIKSSVNDSLLRIDTVDGAVSGKYKCEKKLRDHDGTFHRLSDETYISVRDLFLHPKIKAPPYQIVEDDELTLTCVRRLNPLRDGAQLKFAFFRNGRKVQEFGSSDTYKVKSTQLEDSGNYTCEGRTLGIRRMSDVSPIQVQGLFSHVEVTAPPYGILGHDVTLTCVTRVNPLRARTPLQFSFYWNGSNLQDFSSSDTYIIRSAQLEDSGNYTCEVRTVSGATRKMSDSSQVYIQDFTYWNIMRLVLSLLPLLAAAGLVLYHKKTQRETSGRHV